jgi:hypothetical protein
MISRDSDSYSKSSEGCATKGICVDSIYSKFSYCIYEVLFLGEGTLNYSMDSFAVSFIGLTDIPEI